MAQNCRKTSEKSKNIENYSIAAIEDQNMNMLNKLRMIANKAGSTQLLN